MYFIRLFLFFVVVTTIGLLITRQQISETLLLYQINGQERLARRLSDENQLLNYQANALASPQRLSSALAQKSHRFDAPVAIVRLETKEKGTFLAKRYPRLFERLSLIRAAEARSR